MHRQRKFSAVRGVEFANSSITTRPTAHTTRDRTDSKAKCTSECASQAVASSDSRSAASALWQRRLWRPPTLGGSLRTATAGSAAHLFFHLPYLLLSSLCTALCELTRSSGHGEVEEDFGVAARLVAQSRQRIHGDGGGGWAVAAAVRGWGARESADQTQVMRLEEESSVCAMKE